MFLFVVLLVMTHSVEACSCGERDSVCEAYGQSKAVFVGKVIEGRQMERLSDTIGAERDLPFKFSVSRGFSGAKAGDVIEIHTGTGFGDCGFPFELGQEYIVYAYEHEGKLRTSVCSRTTMLSSSANDVRAIDSLLRSNGATITGSVDRYEISSLLGKHRRPVANLAVKLLLGEEQTFMTSRTDSKGRFTFKKVPRGRYSVAADVETGWRLDFSDDDEFFINDRGCATRYLSIENDSQVVVAVVDPDGNPVKNIWVEFVPVGIDSMKNLSLDDDSFTGIPAEFSVTNPQGKLFTFGLPPGRYTVSVNYLMAPIGRSPYPATFAPGVLDRKKARIIDIRPGTEIDDIVIKIPKRLPL